MPNWCQNEVNISADTKEELDEFIAFVTEDEDLFSFTTILPCDEVSKADVWGTKWSASNLDSDRYADGLEIEYFFDTAWSPPDGIYNALVERFPKLSISWFYREEGVQLAGYLPN